MTRPWWIQKDDLDDYQLKALSLPLTGKYIVTGPPGSGKSNLLVLRARHFVVKNKTDWAILAFNQVLVRFLQSSKTVPSDKITTAMSWLEDQLWDLESRRVSPTGFRERRAAILEALASHLTKRNKQGLIDTLFVDEFQDYSLEEIAIFERIATNLYLVGDIRQQIYESNITEEAFAELQKRFATIELPYHYRVGPNICRLADCIAKPSQSHVKMLAGCRYDAKKDGKDAVDPVYRSPLKGQVDEVIRRLAVQLLAYETDEYIGVLCPTNDVLDEVGLMLLKAFRGQVSVQKSKEAQDFELGKRIVVSTLDNGKGLEYRAVHVLALDVLKRQGSLRGRPRNRQLVYTAVTRGKTRCSLYCDDKRLMNSYLEDAFTPDAGEISADDLF